jgi:hypothetical protein
MTPALFCDQEGVIAMVPWQKFAEANPVLASLGQRLLLLGADYGDFLAGLAYLATIRSDGGPRIHPISPALLDGRLYAFILTTSPKYADLRRDGRYALHSFPPNTLDTTSFTDDEFYLTGSARMVEDPTLRQAVAHACGDDVEAGQVFELLVERAMHKGREEGRARYTKWSADRER